MKRRKAAWLLALAAGWGLILGLTPARPVEAQGSEALVMVVNKANSAAAGTNLGEARKLLLGEESVWRNGAKVLVVLAPAGSPDRATVLKKICGMSEAAYTRYQMQAAFTGQTAAAVHEAPSDAAIKATVRANPGAVGFIHKAAADESVQIALALE
jgi:ABC-type phosphate transport system substrate-binding protein